MNVNFYSRNQMSFLQDRLSLDIIWGKAAVFAKNLDAPKGIDKFPTKYLNCILHHVFMTSFMLNPFPNASSKVVTYCFDCSFFFFIDIFYWYFLQVADNVYACTYPIPLPREGYDTVSIFKRSKADKIKREFWSCVSTTVRLHHHGLKKKRRNVKGNYKKCCVLFWTNL